jgi:hypothetical protein
MENAGFYFFSNAARERRALREVFPHILKTTAPPREQTFVTPGFQTLDRSAVGGYHADKISMHDSEAVLPRAGRTAFVVLLRSLALRRSHREVTPMAGNKYKGNPIRTVRIIKSKKLEQFA